MAIIMIKFGFEKGQSIYGIQTANYKNKIHSVIHGTAYSFMGNTPGWQHQINGINQYLLCKIDYILQSVVEWLQLKL